MNKNKMIDKNIASVFVHCYPPAFGGAEYLTQQFVQVLEQKYNVHVFTGRGETLDSYKTFTHYLPQASDPNIHRLELNQSAQRIFNKLLSKIIFVFGYFSPFYFGPILRYTKREIELIRRSEIIFGVAMPTKSFYDAYYYARKFKKKLILIPTYHNVSHYNRCSFFQKAFDYAHKVFYLTPQERQELTKNYTINPSKLVQTTFCPYNKSQIDAQFKRLPAIIKKHEQHIKNKEITLGFIGQITLRKNLGFFKDYLDKYLSDWQSRGYTLKVYLAGAKTNTSSQLESLFQDYLARKIVTINYDFKDSDKKKEFAKIDIFVNPSVEESLSIVNFEAIFCGCILLVSLRSAFAGLSEKIFSYDGINNFHKNIVYILQKTKFKKYNYINYQILRKYNFSKLSNTLHLQTV